MVNGFFWVNFRMEIVVINPMPYNLSSMLEGSYVFGISSYDFGVSVSSILSPPLVCIQNVDYTPVIFTLFLSANSFNSFLYSSKNSLSSNLRIS